MTPPPGSASAYRSLGDPIGKFYDICLFDRFVVIFVT